VGILRIEKADLENLELVMTVSEDLDCSGLPVIDETVCEYDEGFIAGVLQVYTGKEFHVREVDCWASGERTCRFVAKLLEEGSP
jgi:predicted hydrocarbon binding protein